MIHYVAVLGCKKTHQTCYLAYTVEGCWSEDLENATVFDDPVKAFESAMSFLSHKKKGMISPVDKIKFYFVFAMKLQSINLGI